ncbi:class A beta-lactamase [Naumannella cuiyingiana]|uniref:Beta-lactamase n=1 Tax=Naumannella cuiyingiana TaxID=1347891 RepID=A0A7Z0D9T3_9ACTN|nr:class A beta-lactamase [Naumannella cuiyingiana]NYI71567.1 beta-lactamase class A [Naumannella cuiyingiana]
MEQIARIEERYDRRIGLYAQNLRTGATVDHRADERFAMCSTFKTLAAAAVLDNRLIFRDRLIMDRRQHFPPSLVDGAGYAAVMAAWLEQGHVPTTAEVCEAAVADSDNAAGNLLLQLIGGPGAITALARDLGDRVTELTRWEPALNEWAPGDLRDTTTPRAMGENYGQLVAGRALGGAARRRLTGWLLANRTGADDLRKGLPAGWRLGDKTGSGAYGTRNDVGIAWTPAGVPIVISCLTNADSADAETRKEPLAEVGRLCAELLG